MTRPRSEQISLSDTPYYHIVSRCVRRGFLCGTDVNTGKCYEHRRSWIENRIRLLSSLFAVDICAYAVMSNHLHIVVKLAPDQLDALSLEEIARRWTCLYKGPLLVQKWLKGDALDTVELATVFDIVGTFRAKLKDLGWFMKCLNEPIARQANKEDSCSGHFWESRYKSQALLTEEALLSCMAYVDLNPVRAGMADRPETSDHTSIKERIVNQFNLTEAVNEQLDLQLLLKFDAPVKPLATFEGNVIEEDQFGLLFSLSDYLELVDVTGRCIREGKRGFIARHLPPILERLNLDNENWLRNATRFEGDYNSRFSRRQVLRCKSPLKTPALI